MYHGNRRWCVQQVESVEELADHLQQHSWCGCAGFQLGHYYWLNDSTSPDAVQEYAVVRQPLEANGDHRQVESITVGWCNREQLLRYIRSIHEAERAPCLDSGAVVTARSVAEAQEFFGGGTASEGISVKPVLETPQEHGRCQHCA